MPELEFDTFELKPCRCSAALELLVTCFCSTAVDLRPPIPNHAIAGSSSQ